MHPSVHHLCFGFFVRSVLVKTSRSEGLDLLCLQLVAKGRVLCVLVAANS